MRALRDNAGVRRVMWTPLLWNRMQQPAADWPSECASGCNSTCDPWINISSRLHCFTPHAVFPALSFSAGAFLIGCHAQRFILLRFIRLLLLDVFAREIDVVRLTIRARGKYCHSDCSRGRFRRRRIAVKLTVARPLQCNALMVLVQNALITLTLYGSQGAYCRFSGCCVHSAVRQLIRQPPLFCSIMQLSLSNTAQSSRRFQYIKIDNRLF